MDVCNPFQEWAANETWITCIGGIRQQPSQKMPDCKLDETYTRENETPRADSHASTVEIQLDN